MTENPYDQEITHSSEWFTGDDDHPERFPLVDPTTGREITDPYEWHVFHTMLTMQSWIAVEMLSAMRKKKTIIAMYTHHLEREAGYCKAVVTAKITRRKYP